MSAADPLQCNICSRRHRDPRILDCFHSFCRECLEKHINKVQAKMSFACPMCRTEITIPKSGVKGYKVNYYIRAIQASAAFSTFSNCDTCKETTEAVDRCLECESNFCESCSNRHAENENGREHHIIKLSKPETKSITQLTHKSFCDKHKEENKFYCMFCEVPVCKDCVSKVSDHKGHKYKGIHEGAKEKREKVNPMIKSMHEYLPCLQDYVGEMENCKNMLDGYSQEAIRDIRKRCQFLKDQIDKIGDGLVSEVEKRKEEENERIGKHVDMTVHTIKSVSSINNSVEEILNLGSDAEVVVMCHKVQNRFKHVDKEIPQSGLKSCKSTTFHVGDDDGKCLEDMVGYCEDSDIKMPHLPIPWGLRIALQFEVQLLFSFKVSETMDTIHAIAPISDKEAWICCGWGTNQMHLFSNKGVKLRTQQLDMQIDDIHGRPNGEVFVSSYDGKKVVKLDQDLKATDFVNLNWYPGGITFTKRNELLVCAVDSYVTTRSNTSRRMVIRINESGKILDQLEEDGCQEIFCAPYRLHENMLGDICVSDREENNVRITTLTTDGIVKHYYRGPSEVTLKKPFNPFGIVADKSGHVLVADWSNHSVHLLDLSGQFIGFLLSEKDGIRGPNAMALDKEGNLWVGDTKSTVWIFKYSRVGENGPPS